MFSLKKFFSVLIFALMLMPTCFADDGRNFVKVSDCDVTGFYFKFNDNALNGLKNNVTIRLYELILCLQMTTAFTLLFANQNLNRKIPRYFLKQLNILRTF